MPLSVLELLRAEQSTEQQNLRDPDLEQRQPLVLRNVRHEFRALLNGPVLRPAEEPFVVVWQLLPEDAHAPDDPVGMTHDRVRRLPCRRVQRVDNIRLNLRNGRTKHEVLRDLGTLATRRAGSV